MFDSLVCSALELTSDSLSYVTSRHPFQHVVSAYNYMFYIIYMLPEKKLMIKYYKEDIEILCKVFKRYHTSLIFYAMIFFRNEKMAKLGFQTRQIPPSIFVRRILDVFKERGYFNINEHYR